jgi:hypothetical protein
MSLAVLGALLLSLAPCMVWGYEPLQKRPDIAINHYKNNMSPVPILKLVPLSEALLNFHFIQNNTGLRSTGSYDVLTHSDWSHMSNVVMRGTIPPGHSIMDTKLVDLYENKAQWKDWMISNDMGSYVPITVPTTADPYKDVPFPVIFKLHPTGHFGRGIFIVENATSYIQLQKQISAAAGVTATVEEVLTGMGTTEVSAFGSVFNGNLLSLRCSSLTFSKNNSKISKSGAFVKGKSLQNNEAVQESVACGQDLVAVLRKMFEVQGNYTGLFCTNIKMDQNRQFRLLEINARICGHLVGNDLFVLSGFVPLAFAIRADRIKHNPSNLAYKTDWFASNTIYRRIMVVEQRTLLTGGGWINKKWVSVKNFRSLQMLEFHFNSTYAYGLLNDGTIDKKVDVRGPVRFYSSSHNHVE